MNGDLKEAEKFGFGVKKDMTQRAVSGEPDFDLRARQRAEQSRDVNSKLGKAEGNESEVNLVCCPCGGGADVGGGSHMQDYIFEGSGDGHSMETFDKGHLRLGGSDLVVLDILRLDGEGLKGSENSNRHEEL